MKVGLKSCSTRWRSNLVYRDADFRETQEETSWGQVFCVLQLRGSYPHWYAWCLYWYDFDISDLESFSLHKQPCKNFSPFHEDRVTTCQPNHRTHKGALPRYSSLKSMRSLGPRGSLGPVEMNEDWSWEAWRLLGAGQDSLSHWTLCRTCQSLLITLSCSL